MIENFTLDTDANPENMNMLIEGINKNEEDITAVKESVEEVGSQIGQIANDRGYVITKTLPTGSSFRDIPKVNGKYMVYTDVDAPMAGARWYFIDVIMHNELYVELQARPFTNDVDKIFRRYLINNVWKAWIETATEVNTPIQRPVTGSVTLKGTPQGIYRVFNGAGSFTDFPNTGIYQYGILVVILVENYKIYRMTLVDSSGTKVIKLDGFIDTTVTGASVAWVGNEVPYLPVAVGGINITAQRSAILNNVLHIAFDIQKADKTNFVANVQVSAAVFYGITITHPKNIMFSCWSSNGGILVGNGGVGTLFVDRVLYLIPPIACDTIRITGQFILE